MIIPACGDRQTTTSSGQRKCQTRLWRRALRTNSMLPESPTYLPPSASTRFLEVPFTSKSHSQRFRLADITGFVIRLQLGRCPPLVSMFDICVVLVVVFFISCMFRYILYEFSFKTFCIFLGSNTVSLHIWVLIKLRV